MVKGEGRLRVHVKRATGLKSGDMFGGAADPFVEVVLGKTRRSQRTRAILNKNDPWWEEDLDFV